MKYFLALLLISSISILSLPTLPLDLLGTNLPQLTTTSQYRVFNDLQKQSYSFVPYKYNSNNPPSRYWSYNLQLGANLYPMFLDIGVYAAAQIDFFSGID
jgi:hypothetical protein